MQVIVAKSPFTCDVNGEYSGFPINQGGVSTEIKAVAGDVWASGQAMSYSISLGGYTFDMFQLDVGPLSRSNRIKSDEICTSDTLKVSNSIESGGRWATQAMGDFKMTSGRKFTASVAGPNGLRLKLSCR